MKFGYTIDSLRTILEYLRIIAYRTIDFKEFIRRLKYLEYLCTQSKM